MSGIRFATITVLVLFMVLGACAPGEDVTQPTNTPYEDPPYAVVAAEQMLSDELGVPVDDIEYTAYERQDWPDACLGLAEEDEVCAQVITPGWRVVLAAEGQEYVFRTDANGAIVRRES